MGSEGEEGTDSSSSAGSEISDDTHDELVRVMQVTMAARKADKKRKKTGTPTAVVTAAAAKVSIDKAAQKALRNGIAAAAEKRKKSRDTLSKIIARIDTGTVARTASPQVSGVTKTRDDSSAKKPKRKAALSSDEDDEENHDVVELPAVPAKTRRIHSTVDKLISWLSKSYSSSSATSSSSSSTAADSSRSSTGAASSPCSAGSRSYSTAAHCSGRVSSAARAPLGVP